MKIYFLQQRSSRSDKWRTTEASLQRYELEKLKVKRKSYYGRTIKWRIVDVWVEVPA